MNSIEFYQLLDAIARELGDVSGDDPAFKVQRYSDLRGYILTAADFDRGLFVRADDKAGMLKVGGVYPQYRQAFSGRMAPIASDRDHLPSIYVNARRDARDIARDIWRRFWPSYCNHWSELGKRARQWSQDEDNKEQLALALSHFGFDRPSCGGDTVIAHDVGFAPDIRIRINGGSAEIKIRGITHCGALALVSFLDNPTGD